MGRIKKGDKMLRFIIKRKTKDQNTGLATTTFETLDVVYAQLEAILRRGGRSEDGYDYSELTSVELL